MEITHFTHSARERAFAIGSYASYRASLSRQMLTLRRRLGRTTPRNAKYANAKRKEITAEDVASNPQFVHLLLLQAERAWATAMAMKAAHSEDAGGLKGSTKRHIVSRLRRAVTYASQIAALVDDFAAVNASETDYLEATAYLACLAGAVDFERQSSSKKTKTDEEKVAGWSRCLGSFALAHVIYSSLLVQTQRDIFKEVLAGMVDPSIRYAAYQSRLPRTVAVDTVAKRYFPREQAGKTLTIIQQLDPAALEETETAVTTSPASPDTTAAGKVPTSMTWRGRTAPISDAAIGQSLALTAGAATQLTAIFTAASAQTKQPKDSAAAGSTTATAPRGRKALAAAYDPVLTAAQDTVDAVRQAITELAKEGVPEADPRMQDLRVCDLAANYELISWRVGRNRVLLGRDDGATFSFASRSSRSEPRAGRGGKKGKALQRGRRQSLRQLKSGPASRKGGQAKHSKAVSANRSGSSSGSESKSHRLARLRERVVLFDASTQSLESLKLLPGAGRDTAFVADLDARKAYFSALRCANIAFSYNVVGRRREALALFRRACEHAAAAAAVTSVASDTTSEASAAAGSPASSSVPTLAVSAAQIRTLQTTFETNLLRQHGLVALHAALAATAPPALPQGSLAVPLVDRLATYLPPDQVDLRNLVTYPPRLRPVPVKPIFLDLAWNYLEYPTSTALDGGAATAGAGAGVAAVADGVASAVRKAEAAVAETVGSAMPTAQKGAPGKGGAPAEQQQQQQQRKKGWFGFGGS